LVVLQAIPGRIEVAVVGSFDVSVGGHVNIHLELIGLLAFESPLLDELHQVVKFLPAVVWLHHCLQPLLVLVMKFVSLGF